MSTYAYIQQRNESNRKARQFLHDLLAKGPQTYARSVLSMHVRQVSHVHH